MDCLRLLLPASERLILRAVLAILTDVILIIVFLEVKFFGLHRFFLWHLRCIPELDCALIRLHVRDRVDPVSFRQAGIYPAIKRILIRGKVFIFCFALL